jgi:hypothetical protein
MSRNLALRKPSTFAANACNPHPQTQQSWLVPPLSRARNFTSEVGIGSGSFVLPLQDLNLFRCAGDETSLQTNRPIFPGCDYWVYTCMRYSYFLWWCQKPSGLVWQPAGSRISSRSVRTVRQAHTVRSAAVQLGQGQN